MDIDLPYKYTPRDYQLPLLKAWDEGKTRLVAVWHRRSGKDVTVFSNLIKKAFERVGTYFYFAPTYAQGKKIIWGGMDRDGFKFLDHIPPQVIKKKNETEMKIELKNGSVIQIVGTDNIDSVVGTNPIGCVFTEYSLQNPLAWEYMRPILRENGGWAVFIFTPRGMNHAFKILSQSKDSEEWFSQVLTVDDTKAIDLKGLEAEKKEMPEDLFFQEYYCKFIEGASSFFKRIRENVYYEDIEVKSDHVYQIGVDLAKFRDFTVITPIDLTTFKVGKPERFNMIDYNLQKAKIESWHYKLNRARIVIDSTGVGEPIYEDLSRRIKNVTPFKFTENSRRDLLNNLQIKLQQDIIKIPNDEFMINELNSFQYHLTDTGKVKVGVSDSDHDDMVMSLALSVWGMPNQPIKGQKKTDRELMKQFDFYKKNKSGYLTGARY